MKVKAEVERQQEAPAEGLKDAEMPVCVCVCLCVCLCKVWLEWKRMPPCLEPGIWQDGWRYGVDRWMEIMMGWAHDAPEIRTARPGQERRER